MIAPAPAESEAPNWTGLVLVGRKSKHAAVTHLEAGPLGWVAVVRTGDMADFGRETLDVFVLEEAEGGMTRRRRLSAGHVDLVARPRASRRWYVTEAGNVSARQPSAYEVITEAGVFDEVHYRQQVPDLPTTADPVEHYLTVGAAGGLNPSTVFDTNFYLANVMGARRGNPLAHYCRFGWKELFDPSPLFNTWWYWASHMDLADDTTIPLSHYESVGKHANLSTVPKARPSLRLGPGATLPPSRLSRRVCFFVGWDPEGIIDDYVVDYVRELSRHADVYYLADMVVSDTELTKLAGITKKAWGIRHGRYDFGSYALLTDLVGWDLIEDYDELLLVNDSCYLLRSLDDVFDRMDGRPCDWWGLQATKGIRETRQQPVNQFPDPIPMETVRASMVDSFESDYVYDFLIGSYFVAYRRPVIQDAGFRRYLSSITPLEKKRHIVKKYEVGLTHWLIQRGHAFDTYMPELLPFHPIFSEWYFRLLEQGFPLLKRYFLAENHYNVPELARWPELVERRVPGVDVTSFRRNLERVTDPDKLRRSLNIRSADDLQESIDPEQDRPSSASD